MQQLTVRGDTRPVEREDTNVLYIVRRDIHEYTEVREGETVTGFEWTEVRLTKAEEMAVRAGRLPAGITKWDADLRRIERSALLDRADVLLAEASDHVGSDAWAFFATSVHVYKNSVRDSVKESGFPEMVIYPELPSKPE